MHTLVVGITGSGKSRLAKEHIIPGWHRRGYAVLVLDPLAQPWPGAYRQTDDPMRFLDWMQRGERCIGIVDECSTSLRGDANLERQTRWLATQSRNRGHKVYFLGQRVLQMQPDVRNNCSEAFVFMQTPADARWFAEQWNLPAIEADAPRLPLGVCLRCSPFSDVTRLRVFCARCKRSDCHGCGGAERVPGHAVMRNVLGNQG